VTNLQDPERLLPALLVAVAAEVPGAHRTSALAWRVAVGLSEEGSGLRPGPALRRVLPWGAPRVARRRRVRRPLPSPA